MPTSSRRKLQLRTHFHYELLALAVPDESRLLLLDEAAGEAAEELGAVGSRKTASAGEEVRRQRRNWTIGISPKTCAICTCCTLTARRRAHTAQRGGTTVSRQDRAQKITVQTSRQSRILTADDIRPTRTSANDFTSSCSFFSFWNFFPL